MTWDEQHPGWSMGRQALSVLLLLGGLLTLGWLLAERAHPYLLRPSLAYAGPMLGLGLLTVASRLGPRSRLALFLATVMAFAAFIWFSQHGCYSDGFDSGACPSDRNYDLGYGLRRLAFQVIEAATVLVIACGLGVASRWIGGEASR